MNYSTQGRSSALLATLLAAMFLTPVTAAAQVTAAEATCRATIASLAGKYVKTLQKVIGQCHKARNKGSVDTLVDCNDSASADSKGKADKSATRLHDSVVAKCAATPNVLGEFPRCPAPFETVDDGGATTGIDDWEEMVACEISHLRSAVEDMTVEVLGLPNAGMTSEQQKCHATIAKRLSKAVDTTAKVRATCQKLLDKAEGPLDFVCATADPDDKISVSFQKAEASIADACATDEVVAGIDSCSETTAGLTDCIVYGIGEPAGGSLATMPWIWRGYCPGGAALYFVQRLRDTDVDLGSTGFAHNIDPTSPFDPILRYGLSCDADCANCTTTEIAPPANACRCSDKITLVCSDNTDCAGAGDECWCYAGPPTPVNYAGGLPACLTTRIEGPITGSVDPQTGEVEISTSLSLLVYSGEGQLAPCPICKSGFCEGGARDGLACLGDAVESTFGRVSYDCPPSDGKLLSGSGKSIPMELSTGSYSLPFGVACDSPYEASMCACSTCSLDNSIACNSDADCAAVLAGTCRTDGLHQGHARRPNDCSDLTCSPDPGGEDDEGACLAGGPGDVFHFCDGAVREDGRGILGCNTNADCENDWQGVCAEDPLAPCGSCSITENRPCFLDPIAADGKPYEQVVGGGCVPSIANVTVNLMGLPGPFRMQRAITIAALCPDGVSDYEPPDGYDCP